MLAFDTIALAFGALNAQRLRSGLTILGIAVGIGSVVLLTAIGEGIRRYVLAEFTQFGTNLIAVVPGKVNTMGISGASISNVRPLTLDDAAALNRLAPIRAVSPVVQGNVNVEFGARSRRTILLGVGTALPKVWRMEVSQGRFLPDDPYRSARAFAVLGSRMRDELFGDINPLGKRIRIGGVRARIIGVMEPKGNMLGFDMDDTIYIPAAKALDLFDRESLMEIDLLYQEGADEARVKHAVERLLLARHGHEDFTIITQNQMLDVLDKVLGVLTLGIAALGGISLAVGAVGITTIMTIAVTERTGEVGLLRAMGAHRRAILHLFLAEATVLGGVGGSAGILGALLIVHGIGSLVPGLPLATATHHLILALSLSLLIGLAAGVAPAMRAASMRPLDALRTE